ncbi:MAG: ribosome maturation factor RimP [Hyphomicrobiales bacterium]|nr:ribosome maturation factor RimP [Hyphomicrobiales bacterium]MCP5370158.1 ribosome maturation factor RimP [Hyphomicrobiales bacterium]
MTLETRIDELIGPTVAAMGFDVVRIELSGTKRPRLQVMVERHDGAGITVDDCADVSRAVAAVLDVEDPVHGAYILEVSSPGIDRPLVRLADYQRFAGLEAKVHLKLPLDGRRRLTGRLLGVSGDDVRLTVDGAPLQVAFADIQKAKLVLNDELLARAEEREENERSEV